MPFMGKISWLLVFIFSCGAMSFAQPTAAAYAQKLKSLYKETVPLVQSADLAQILAHSEQPLLLDSRSPEEFAVSHLLGAQLVDFKGFRKETAKAWEKNRLVVVYCTVGYRSERIGEQLLKMGFKNVHNLYGGIFEWVNQGHAIVDSQGNPTPKVHAYNQDWGQWLLKGEKVYR